jgi:hypothetical protein
LCVFCAIAFGDQPRQVQPVADTRTGPAPTTPAYSALPAQPLTPPAGGPALALLPNEPDPVGPVGGAGPSATASGLAADGIPTTALAAYQHAAAVLGVSRPSCHLDWPVLAAIGRVESDHGRFGGAVLTTAGISVPPVLGPRLDGVHFPLVPDTDGGLLDGDPVYDRAVGPMQFLPSTWRALAPGINNGGQANPFDIVDAAVGAGIYLCGGSTNLADPASLHAAIYRYNHSDSYVATVLSLAARYRAEVTVISNTAPAPTTTPTHPTTVAPTSTTAPTTLPTTPTGASTTTTTMTPH